MRDNNASRIWKKRKTLYTVGGIIIGTDTMENSMEVPQNFKNRI